MTKKIKQAYTVLSSRSRILLVACFILITTVGFATAANGIAGNFTNPTPTSDVNTTTPTISVHLSADGTYDLSQVSMEIDGGAAFKPTVNGTGPEYDLSYTPSTPLKEGNHTVTVKVVNNTDSANPYTANWSFNVIVPPVITKYAPTITVTTATPVISAYATDNTGLAKGEFKIDDPNQAPIAGTLDKTLGRISFKPTTPLTNGSHKIYLTVYDSNNNSVTKDWSFNVDTNVGGNFPDMPVVNNATCWKCHPTLLAVNEKPKGTAIILGGKHAINTSCQVCHISQLASSKRFQECTYCHYDNYPTGSPRYMSTRHTTSYANVDNLRHPINDKHLSSTNNGCEKCHSRILTKEHFRTDRVRKDINGNPINCDTCHTANYLGDEITTDRTLRIEKTLAYQVQYSGIWNAPQGRTISRVYIDQALDANNFMEVYALYNGNWGLVYGQVTGTTAKWIDLPDTTTALRTKIYSPTAMTPASWGIDVPKVTLTPNEASPNFAKYTKIQTAIANKDTSCGACHTNLELGHDAQHNNTEFDTKNCTTSNCHTNIISNEHTNRKDKLGNDLTCDTCHKSVAKEVKRTIAAKSLSCNGCHKKAHNINLTDKIPADIPINTLFDQWSTPLEASLFNGELPQGYDNGQMVISNRKTTTCSAIWDFYNTQLTANSWILKSTPPASDATNFSVQFEKSGRFVTVKAYNTLNSDGSGGVLDSGYRTELWYK